MIKFPDTLQPVALAARLIRDADSECGLRRCFAIGPSRAGAGAAAVL